MKTPLKFLILLTVLLGACKKYHADSPTGVAASNAEIQASEDFSWSTTRDFETNLVFEGELAGQALSFEILDENFNRMYKLHKASVSNSIKISQFLSSALDSVFIYAPEVGFFQKVSANAKTIRISPQGGNSLASNPVLDKGMEQGRSMEKSGCSSCAVVLPSGYSNQNINTNQKVCVTGTSTAQFTFNNGGEISVCGTLTINNLNINGNGLVNIVVHPGGTLNVSGMNMNGKGTIVNNGTIVFKNTYSITTYFENNGVAQANYTLNINSGTSPVGNRDFINNGSMTINGDANFDYKAFNNGTMYVKENFKNNTNTFVNNCSVESGKGFHMNSVFINNAFIKVGAIFQLNGGSSLFMKNLSLIKARDMHLNAVVSSDGIGVFASNAYTKINSGFGISSGLIDLCDGDGNIEINNANATTLSKLKFCETPVVADGGCFFEGHAVAGSGTPGSFVYPSTGSAYRAFEDLWPAKGDYDFNDMVVKYNYEASTNAFNNVTQIDFDITLPALGASYKNGLALQILRKNGNSFTRVTGNIFESSQNGVFVDPNDPNVIIISPNVFETIPTHYRNVGDGAEGTPHNFQVSILVKESAAVSATDFVADLFLFRSTNRGLEVHMPGVMPSAAASNALFNTVDDDSQNGWYRDANNMPWAIEIISSVNWKHPLTKVPVWQAYPNFIPWVNSNGESNTNWYESPIGNLVYQTIL